MSETPSQASDTPNVNDSPGELLARRREQLDIALNDAARALNLRPAVVDGLERDDYSEIPVVTYRRGYLRAYAKYLDLDERQILEAYRARFGEADVERKVTPVAVTRPPSRLGAWLFKLVTLLIIVALIAVTVMWWQSRGGSELPDLDSSSSMNAPAEQDQAGDLSDEPTQTEPDASSSEPEEVPTFDDLVAEDDTGTAESDLAAEGTADDTSETSNDTSSTEPDPASLVDGDEAAQANDLATTDSEEDDSNNDDGSNDANPNLLTLTFNEQSWTEIIDADNQRVLVGLQEPGTSASVEGQPPFRLTVGNVTGVEMRYQGENVDLTSRAGANNVARFTLGE
ncbi:helix-turn-helix domain-containing protein [Halomonas sp. SH5A2]|uniref:RodZ domain-containing protein n=1 Tax=Halomonas sp. SH5A2 TaxID=2749040 RepID=UPI001640B7A1|nr:RodZ domain-containing protein [Halomonas sp. SH5A2]QNI01994.1 helix-turn-helix domain-containing protein [Halomonas sp. SH5A2]